VSEAPRPGSKAAERRLAERTAIRWLWLSVVVVLLDQVTKLYIVAHFELYERLEVLPLLDITRLHNTGAAFSFLAGAGGWQRWFFIVLGLVVSGLVVAWLARLPLKGRGWLAAALSLVVGGAIGNVIDRAWHGYVIDFISVHHGEWYFPAFNVADSAITVGAAILLIESLLGDDGRIPSGREHES
jgi:signal peptidase II